MDKPTIRILQFLLATLGYYDSAIDGDAGPKTLAGVRVVLDNMRLDYNNWSKSRMLWGALQRILDTRGYEPGVVDGWNGHNTQEALTAYLSDTAGTKATVERKPIREMSQVHLPLQSQCKRFYGDPGEDEVKQYIKRFELPFPMRIDWNLSQTVTRVSLHEKCGPAFQDAMEDLLAEYGLARLQTLGIDRFAGSYVHRKMRGGSSWSMHAYGCAVDIYAAPNSLRTRCPDALFCGEEYQPFLDIMEKNNWLPAIRLWGADAMHFQMARI